MQSNNFEIVLQDQAETVLGCAGVAPYFKLLTYDAISEDQQN